MPLYTLIYLNALKGVCMHTTYVNMHPMIFECSHICMHALIYILIVCQHPIKAFMHSHMFVCTHIYLYAPYKGLDVSLYISVWTDMCVYAYFLCQYEPDDL